MEFIDLVNLELRKMIGSPPETIYHYTGAKGLIGILKENKVWATKIEYLNDPIEEVYGREIVSSVAAEEALKEKDEDISYLLTCVAKNLTEYCPGCETDYYVVSFSEKPNDLSQWKMYGYDGWGYSVGIEVGGDAVCNENIIPVIYKKEKQIEQTKKFIRVAIEYLQKNKINKYCIDAVYHDLIPFLKILISSMKQEAYSHEKEWRLVFSPNKGEMHNDLEFREGKNQTVVPYIPIRLPGNNGWLNKVPVSKITVGPQRESDVTSLKLLLSSCSYPKNLLIKKSNIRYRS